MAKLNSPPHHRERGQAVIELALTLPLLLLVVLGIFDFGFMFQKYEVVTNAAREGARVGVLPGYVPGDARNRALAYLDAGGLGGPGTSTEPAGTCPSGRTLTPNRRCAVATETTTTLPAVPPATTGKVVTQIVMVVEYDYEFRFVGPLMNLFGGTLGTTRLRAVSTMRAEPD